MKDPRDKLFDVADTYAEFDFDFDPAIVEDFPDEHYYDDDGGFDPGIG